MKMKRVTLKLSDTALKLAQWAADEYRIRPEEVLAGVIEFQLREARKAFKILSPDEVRERDEIDLREIEEDALRIIEDPGGGVHVVGDLDDDIPF